MSALATLAPWRETGLADGSKLVRRAGLTGSILFHVAAAGLLLWFQARPGPVATAADEPIELVFEALPAPPEPVPAVAPMQTVAPEPDALPPDVTSPVEPSPAEASPGAAMPQLVVPEPPGPQPPVPQPVVPRVAQRAPAHPAQRITPPRAAARAPEMAPAVAPAVTALMPAPRVAAPAIVDPAWRLSMSSWLRAHQQYPEMARRRGTEGVVGITFTVARDGQVQAVAVTSSSGSPVLDDAARDMLDRQRLPAFPVEMAQLQAQVSVKIRYTLD